MFLKSFVDMLDGDHIYAIELHKYKSNSVAKKQEWKKNCLKWQFFNNKYKPLDFRLSCVLNLAS